MKNGIRYVFIVFVLVSFGLLKAQSPFVRIYPGQPSSLPNQYVPSRPTCIEKTLDGGFLIGGGTGEPDTPGMAKMQLRKVDSQGNLIWEVKDRITFNDGIKDVIEFSGSIYTASILDAQPGISKKNSVGETIWVKNLLANTDTCGVLSVIKSTSDACLLVGGAVAACNSSVGGRVFLAKVDTSGNIIWQHTYNSQYLAVCYDLFELNDSTIFVVGTTPELVGNILESRLLLMHINLNDGNLIMQKAINELGIGFSAKRLSEKIIVVTGEIGDEAGLILVNDTGKVLSVVTDSFPGFNSIVKVLSDSHYIYTLQKGYVSFVQGNITYSPELIRIIKYNKNDLSVQSEKIFPIDTFPSSRGEDMVLLDGGKLAIVFYLSSIDCPGCTGLVLLDSTGCVEEWCITDVPKIESSLIISVSPNPFEKYINVKIEDNQYSKIDLQLTDIEGRIIYQSEITTYLEKRIDASELKPGMYFLTLLAEDKKWIKKVIKM